MLVYKRPSCFLSFLYNHPGDRVQVAGYPVYRSVSWPFYQLAFGRIIVSLDHDNPACTLAGRQPWLGKSFPS